MPLITTQSAKGYGFGSASAAIPNSYESIATYVISSSTSSVTFSSIPSTFKHLQVRCFMKNTTGGTDPWAYSLQAYLNGDTTVGNYAYHRIRSDDGGSVVSDGGANGISYLGFIPGDGVASVFTSSLIDIIDYANTNKNKTFRAINGSNNNGTNNGFMGFQSQLWKNTAAVNSLELRTSGGNFAQYSHFALYGIKG